MPDIASTVAEFSGAALVVVGVFITFGVGLGCIVAGFTLLAGSWAVNR